MATFVQNGLSRKRQADLTSDVLKIGILNLMPNKKETEEQFLSIFDKLADNIAVYFFYPASHHFKTIDPNLIRANYLPLTHAGNLDLDGWIMTGAPVERLPFEEVDYWDELQDAIALHHRRKDDVLYECWAAQAGLYVNYGIDKEARPRKLSGIFATSELDHSSFLTRGFSAGGLLRMPQSRHTGLAVPNEGLPAPLRTVAFSRDVGPIIMEDSATGEAFVTGHPEYTRETLAKEYKRDVLRGLAVSQPRNYYVNYLKNKIDYSWRKDSLLFYQNWLTRVSKKKVVKNL